MNYPKKVCIFGHDIDVIIQDKPFSATQLSEDKTDYIMAYYDPTKTQIGIFHNPDKPAIGGSNFYHEVIEAIDKHGDLQLNHTQISTLASCMYQVFQEAA